ncbi:MAG: hypothetical protein COX57_13305 [Alphaproteobacteria bacterium CG_4_10_14_0_2_um_filter_63_37]|nr:MAG: hypothetical protein AUJ55_12600 [Proteobacteria bacterium CG1_02_64_396]PJA23462.1 MAG: hypothetical protein COX57_13305 [Alphaproteobacteria bacterium CG_4_10_14_0_2_um_filter_63_37]
MAQPTLDILGRAPRRFESFLASSHNRNTVAFLERLARGQERMPLHSLGIVGPAGSGKSHLLEAFAAVRGVEVTRPEQVPSPVDEAFEPFVFHHLTAGSVVLDDVQRLNTTAQEGMVHLYNRLKNQGGMLLYASSGSILELDLLPDLRSRLLWGPVLPLFEPEEEEQLAIAAQLAQERGFNLPEGSERWLTEQGPRRIGELIALMDDLHRGSLTLRRPITLVLLRQQWRAMHPSLHD